MRHSFRPLNIQYVPNFTSPFSKRIRGKRYNGMTIAKGRPASARNAPLCPAYNYIGLTDETLWTGTHHREFQRDSRCSWTRTPTFSVLVQHSIRPSSLDSDDATFPTAKPAVVQIRDSQHGTNEGQRNRRRAQPIRKRGRKQLPYRLTKQLLSITLITATLCKK